MGPGNRKNRARGGVKKNDPLPCSAVRCRDLLRGPACPEVNTNHPLQVAGDDATPSTTPFSSHPLSHPMPPSPSFPITPFITLLSCRPPTPSKPPPAHTHHLLQTRLQLRSHPTHPPTPPSQSLLPTPCSHPQLPTTPPTPLLLPHPLPTYPLHSRIPACPGQVHSHCPFHQTHSPHAPRCPSLPPLHPATSLLSLPSTIPTPPPSPAPNPNKFQQIPLSDDLDSVFLKSNSKYRCNCYVRFGSVRCVGHFCFSQSFWPYTWAVCHGEFH